MDAKSADGARRSTRRQLAHQVELIERQRVCRTCGAATGDRCVTASGTPRSMSHVARFVDARSSGDLPMGSRVVAAGSGGEEGS